MKERKKLTKRVCDEKHIRVDNYASMSYYRRLHHTRFQTVRLIYIVSTV